MTIQFASLATAQTVPAVATYLEVTSIAYRPARANVVRTTKLVRK